MPISFMINGIGATPEVVEERIGWPSYIIRGTAGVFVLFSHVNAEVEIDGPITVR